MSTGIRTVAALVNPISGSAAARRATDAALDRLADRGVEVVRVSGADEADTRRRVRDVAASGDLDALVVCGGDGMVSLVVDAMLSAPGSSERSDPLPVAIVPTGTGNDLAREYGLPIGDPSAAADLVVDGMTRPVDLGRVEPADGPVRYFASILCVGLDSEVSARVNAMRWMWGRIRYVAATLVELTRYRPVDVRITVDDEVVHDGPLFLSATAVTRYYGGGMQIAPWADPRDGLFDLVFVPAVSPMRLLRSFASVYRGSHMDDDDVGSARGSRVRFEPRDGAPGVRAHADGDEIGRLPLTVSVVSGGILLVIPG